MRVNGVWLEDFRVELADCLETRFPSAPRLSTEFTTPHHRTRSPPRLAFSFIPTKPRFSRSPPHGRLLVSSIGSSVHAQQSSVPDIAVTRFVRLAHLLGQRVRSGAASLAGFALALVIGGAMPSVAHAGRINGPVFVEV